MPSKIKKPRSMKYGKITHKKKHLLLNLIFQERAPNKEVKNHPIKAAGILGINYSTAKTVLHFFRKRLKQPVHPRKGRPTSQIGCARTTYRELG